MVANEESFTDPIIIKKYANRRLYDTSSSSYVTLEYLSRLVRDGKIFEVQDAKSGEDLTRSVLTQIIVEQEGKGGNALPVKFLREVIRLYGDSAASALPTYLDMAISNFTKNQQRWRDLVSNGMAGNPMSMFEEQARRNFEMFERGMNLFTSGVPAAEVDKAPPPPPAPAKPSAQPAKLEETADDTGEDTLEALRKQMEDMQSQLARLTGDSSILR